MKRREISTQDLVSMTRLMTLHNKLWKSLLLTQGTPGKSRETQVGANSNEAEVMDWAFLVAGTCGMRFLSDVNFPKAPKADTGANFLIHLSTWVTKGEKRVRLKSSSHVLKNGVRSSITPFNKFWIFYPVKIIHILKLNKTCTFILFPNEEQ